MSIPSWPCRHFGTAQRWATGKRAIGRRPRLLSQLRSPLAPPSGGRGGKTVPSRPPRLRRLPRSARRRPRTSTTQLVQGTGTWRCEVRSSGRPQTPSHWDRRMVSGSLSVAPRRRSAATWTGSSHRVRGTKASGPSRSRARLISAKVSMQAFSNDRANGSRVRDPTPPRHVNVGYCWRRDVALKAPQDLPAGLSARAPSSRQHAAPLDGLAQALELQDIGTDQVAAIAFGAWAFDGDWDRSTRTKSVTEGLGRSRSQRTMQPGTGSCGSGGSASLEPRSWESRSSFRPRRGQPGRSALP